jgi:hypothetical protein
LKTDNYKPTIPSSIVFRYRLSVVRCPLSVLPWDNVGKGMDPRFDSPNKQPQAQRANLDPLASPTLAALYASQGHADLAEAIYATLGRRSEKNGLPEPVQIHPQRPEADQTFLRRLLSLRQAARQVRKVGWAGDEGSG